MLQDVKVKQSFNQNTEFNGIAHSFLLSSIYKMTDIDYKSLKLKEMLYVIFAKTRLRIKKIVNIKLYIFPIIRFSLEFEITYH